MADLHIERITLDYQGAPLDPEGKLLRNLSAVAVAGDYLWTASDEGRTVECLKRDGKGYRFSDQIKLDDRFEDLPKKHDPGEGLPEADIESLAIHDGYLWICGSHCHVRRHVRGKAKAQPGDAPDVRRLSPKLRDRPSRHLLGRVKIEGDGGRLAETGENLPFGRRGLSAYLADDAFLGPFLSLPSKENGLDIEGLAISESGTVLLGLRGDP